MSSGAIKNKELFESMPVAKAVRTMAVPTVVGQLIVLIYNMADTFFVGRTNNPYMVAGASLILPLFNVLPALAAIMGVGGGSLISRLLGSGRTEEARKVSGFSILFSLGVALTFSLGVLAFMRPLLMLLGAGSETYDYARYYALCVIVFGAVPTVMANMLAYLVRSVGESGKSGFGITMGGIVNMILDPIVMFVILPQGYEILGAGIATAISNCVSCTYFILVIRHLGRDSVLGLSRELPQRENVVKIFSVGVPPSLATLLFDVDYMVISRLMSGYSDIALAAVGIVLKVERLPLNVGIGICQGMVPIVAYNYSAKNYKRMHAVERYSLMLGLVCCAASLTLYELFAPQIMHFFINDAETVALGTVFLRVRSLATTLMFMSFYHVHLFNGYGQGKYSLFLGVSRWVAFNIPMLFILNRLMGMNGLVWAQLAGDILTVLLSISVHRWYVYNFLEKEETTCAD